MRSMSLIRFACTSARRLPGPTRTPIRTTSPRMTDRSIPVPLAPGGAGNGRQRSPEPTPIPAPCIPTCTARSSSPPDEGDFMRFSLILMLGAAVALAGCGGGSSASSAPTSTPAALAVNHAHSILVMPNNPNDLLMGAHYRLYKSTNGGKSWQPLVNQIVLFMALDTTHPSTIYAVSLQKGLEKSVDGGAHWSPLNVGIAKGHLTGVSFVPASHVVLPY